MPVDPLLLPLLEAASEQELLPADAARARAIVDERSRSLIGEWYRPGPEPASIEQVSVPVSGGAIPVRLYRPAAEPPFGVHVYLHGGGFWLGSLESCDVPCRELCVRAGVLVASVGYRLAPEHRFPVPAEDCYEALRWVAEHASELGADASRLSVGGESAGGNLAAVVSLMARDRGGPRICLQVLGIPVTDLTMSQPSVDALGEDYLLTRRGILEYRSYYLTDLSQATHPYASPLLAPDLTGLPDALVLTMEFDPLRDEGEAFARRLAEAGVRVRHRRFAGQIHGSALFTARLPAADEYLDLLVGEIKGAAEREALRV